MLAWSHAFSLNIIVSVQKADVPGDKPSLSGTEDDLGKPYKPDQSCHVCPRPRLLLYPGSPLYTLYTHWSDMQLELTFLVEAPVQAELILCTGVCFFCVCLPRVPSRDPKSFEVEYPLSLLMLHD